MQQNGFEKEQTIADMDSIGMEILFAARNELYMNLPYLDVALCALGFSASGGTTPSIATDGATLWYNSDWLVQQYLRSRVSVSRAYLHVVLHCMLRHLHKKRGKNPLLWDLACDAAVESILCQLDYRCLNEGDVPAKRKFIGECQQDMAVLTAEAIYHRLLLLKLEDYEISAIHRAFWVDDHELWAPEKQDDQSRQQDEKWQDLSEKTQTIMETVLSDSAKGGEAVLEQVKVAVRDDVDYRAFLRRFAVPREIMAVDGDSFDYIYYSYGLQLYGNMPLVEPPETKEDKRIEDFVIAVDTSMSTTGELVRRFLACTYAILRSTETFTRKVNIRIIQCDDRVRKDTVIHKLEELREYMDNFELVGGSATDFRPVFEHVAQLQKEGAFTCLRGLIYFTDGMGGYPKKRPIYDTAFVMLGEPPLSIPFPPWAIKLILEMPDLEKAAKQAAEQLPDINRDELPRTQGVVYMNIKQAKQEILNTLRAYLAKDKLGNYLIPTVRQRPVLLMGPPGIGKTQIMEQIAAQTGVGLVAYTITHHTRQSAIGLPFIEKRSFNGEEFTVTEYTMSEILASVYQLMERTGLREGILFLDEINCVSETLAPMMLQFLQCKTFGNQRLPEGWLIVAAGNPPEYNKSVRDFDVVTLDRVKRIDVSENFAVWKEYAYRKGIHGAVISYLDIKKENFYRIETTVDGLQFATGRGWEDLSELILAYEQLDIKVDRGVVEQYIQIPRIAKDFANYLELYYKYQRTYNVDAVLKGNWPAITESELRAAPFDEKLSVMGLIISRLSEAARNTRRQDAITTAIHGELKLFKAKIGENAEPLSALDEIIAALSLSLKKDKEAGRLDREVRDLVMQEINILEDYRAKLSRDDITDSAEAMCAIKEWFGAEVKKRGELGKAAGEEFDNAFRFLENTFGQGQELVIFVTEITAGYDTSWFVENFGCDAYFRHNRELLFDDTRRRIHTQIAAAKAAEFDENKR